MLNTLLRAFETNHHDQKSKVKVWVGVRGYLVSPKKSESNWGGVRALLTTRMSPISINYWKKHQYAWLQVVSVICVWDVVHIGKFFGSITVTWRIYIFFSKVSDSDIFRLNGDHNCSGIFLPRSCEIHIIDRKDSKKKWGTRFRRVSLKKAEKNKLIRRWMYLKYSPVSGVSIV